MIFEKPTDYITSVQLSLTNCETEIFNDSKVANFKLGYCVYAVFTYFSFLLPAFRYNSM